MSDNEKFMRAAIREARKALALLEVPVGAVAVLNGKVIARAHNRRETLADPTAHAEILCIKKAAKALGGWRLRGMVIYSTLEPCAMCAGAIVHSRVKELVYGADDPKMGACGSVVDMLRRGLFNHDVKVTGGVLKKECSEILSGFFKGLR